jgi:hypothetical protein
MIKGEIRGDGPSLGLEHEGRVRRRDPPQQVQLLIGQRTAGLVVPKTQGTVGALGGCGQAVEARRSLGGRQVGRLERGMFPGAYRFQGREWRVPAAALDTFEAGERNRGVRPLASPLRRTSAPVDLSDWRKAS